MVKTLNRPLAAFGNGARQVARAWRYVLLAYAVNLALTLGLAVFVQDALRSSLGSSLAGERMKANWDSFWYASFSAGAEGVAASFRPSVSGPGAVLDALEAQLDGFAAIDANFWPLLATYWAAWSFLSAGFVSWFVVPDRRVGFLARAAGLFGRFLPISLVGLCGYAAILGPIRSWADTLVASRLRQVSDERVHFAWTLGEYLFLWTLVVLVSLVIDYAKVFVARKTDASAAARVVALSFGAAVRFVARRLASVAFLHGLIGLVGLLLMVFYVAFVPGALDATAAAVFGTFLFGQVFVLSRMALRCLFYASEAALVAEFADAPRTKE